MYLQVLQTLRVMELTQEELLYNGPNIVHVKHTFTHMTWQVFSLLELSVLIHDKRQCLRYVLIAAYCMTNISAMCWGIYKQIFSIFKTCLMDIKMFGHLYSLLTLQPELMVVLEVLVALECLSPVSWELHWLLNSHKWEQVEATLRRKRISSRWVSAYSQSPPIFPTSSESHVRNYHFVYLALRIRWAKQYRS